MSVLTDSNVVMDADPVPSPSSYFNHSTSWTPSSESVPVSTNPSRKRSRDESAFEQAEAENPYFSAPPDPIPEVPEEQAYTYGEGMTLVPVSTGRALAAESQTGTWYEDKVAQEATAKADAAQRPKLAMGRKSQRISQSSIKAALGTPVPSDPASPPKHTPSAEIDEATIALGIGWTKMSTEDPDLQAAARGWARYLEVHYPRHIHGAEILLKHRGLDAYLVGCQEGFYLFQENLLEGKLVGRTWDATLSNLRAQPMQFEGIEVLQAERTPGPEAESKIQATNGWQEANMQATIGNGIISTGHVTTSNGSTGGFGGGMDVD